MALGLIFMVVLVFAGGGFMAGFQHFRDNDALAIAMMAVLSVVGYALGSGAQAALVAA